MSIKREIIIKCLNQTDADTIAAAMQDMSGCFSAKEWKAISKKLQSKANQARIKLLI